MIPRNAVIFLSGRLMALVVLLGFQVLLVRVLGAPEYAAYALVFGFATLMQTVVSLGIPRVISKYVSQAGWKLPNRAVRGLIWRLMVVRVAGSTLLMAITLAVLNWTGLAGTPEPRLLIAGGLFILASLIQMDADSMAQALMLQRVSRACTVGEAVTRFTVVALLASQGLVHGAADVLDVSLTTMALSAIVLLRAVFKMLNQPDRTEQFDPLDMKELRAIGLSSYAASMAWFASSPAVIRMIGGHLLAVNVFAGFAFAQSLVLSFQRYTLGALIYPFLEPSVMKHYAATGDRHTLENALSFIIKMDLICIGAAVVGTAVAGPAIVSLLTGGKYVNEAYAMPWLLIYVTSGSIYKSFEIVAVALGAASVLLKTVTLSFFWLAAAIFLGERYGLVALLLCPVGDALSRLVMMHHALVRLGVRHVIDVRSVTTILLSIAVCGLGGADLAHLMGTTRSETIMVGTLAGLVFLGVIALLRPFRTAELNLISRGRSSGPIALAYRLARP